MGKRGKHDWSKEYLPVGTIKMRRRRRSSGKGFIEVRFVKVKPLGPNKWIPLAKFTWEQTHGPVPPGKRVVHLDGNTLNDNPSNYGLLTSGELIRLAHKLDWQMSDENRRGRKRLEAIAAHNRLRGQIRRATQFLPTRWYAVQRSNRLVINEPKKSRRQLAALFGLSIAINGAIASRRLAALDVEFLRGREVDAIGGRHFQRLSQEEFFRQQKVAA